MANYYNLLGVKTNADLITIKAAYRKLAKEFHPDLNQHDPHAEALFKRINEAYDVLSDPIKRRNYDLNIGNNSRNSRTNETYSRSSRETVTTPFNNQRNYEAAYSEVFMQNAKEEPRYKISEIHWKNLPFAHYIILSILVLMLILFVTANKLQGVSFSLIFLIIQAFLSSFWVNNMSLTGARKRSFQWLGITLIHITVIPATIFLSLVFIFFFTALFK